MVSEDQEAQDNAIENAPTGVFNLPGQLVYIDEDQKLRLDMDALEFLRDLPKPIHCITLAGVAREGKSTWLTMFLRWLDRKLGKGDTNQQFRISKGVVTCTSGSWLWGTTEVSGAHGSADATQLPDGHEGSLLLIDTQGLASGNQEGLNRLFTFSVLLSNVLVLNVLRQVVPPLCVAHAVQGERRHAQQTGCCLCALETGAGPGRCVPGAVCSGDCSL